MEEAGATSLGLITLEPLHMIAAASASTSARLAAATALCRQVLMQWVAGILSPADDASAMHLPDGLATLLAPRCVAAVVPGMEGLSSNELFDLLPVQTVSAPPCGRF
jgi:hypothetical protein